jgi:beta-glucanase (GH16 family)
MVIAVFISLLAVVLPSTHLHSTTHPTAKSDWKLAWSDEFTKPGAPDPAYWRYESGFLRNHEAQYYTRDRRQNVRVENGCLVIEARRERIPVPGKPDEYTTYTSGSIETAGEAHWKYGRFEVRAKIPAGRGVWPAIWLLPDPARIRAVGWPMCGEIDVMENVGFEPGRIHGSIHTKAYNWVARTQKTAIINIDHPERQFHVYAMEWSPQNIDLFVDGRKYLTFDNDHRQDEKTWPFDHPFRLKLNLAIGGDWGGQKGIDDSIFPQKFLVDYVRVSQRGDGK